MPNIFHQSVEDILKAATPEQKILWNYVFLQFGERIAVSQYFFTGNVVGAELSTYVARKIYLCYQLDWTVASTAAIAIPQILTFYDENNILFDLMRVGLPYWDATAAALRFTYDHSITKSSFYFSRLAGTAPSERIKFIGYRITY